jgi:hypothetical protein
LSEATYAAFPNSIVEQRFLVIASEAKQSSSPLAEAWIASSLRSSQ